MGSNISQATWDSVARLREAARKTEQWHQGRAVAGKKLLPMSDFDASLEILANLCLRGENNFSEDRDWILCHAEREEKCFPHERTSASWLQNQYFMYEPVTTCLYRWDDFYRKTMFELAEMRQYDVDEAMRYATCTGSSGPWPKALGMMMNAMEDKEARRHRHNHMQRVSRRPRRVVLLNRHLLEPRLRSPTPIR